MARGKIERVEVKVLGTIPGHPKGSVVSVRCDSEGTPLEEKWRRRIRDAKRDGCVEVSRPEPPRRRNKKRRALQEGLAEEGS